MFSINPNSMKIVIPNEYEDWPKGIDSLKDRNREIIMTQKYRIHMQYYNHIPNSECFEIGTYGTLKINILILCNDKANYEKNNTAK